MDSSKQASGRGNKIFKKFDILLSNVAKQMRKVPENGNESLEQGN